MSAKITVLVDIEVSDIILNMDSLQAHPEIAYKAAKALADHDSHAYRTMKVGLTPKDMHLLHGPAKAADWKHLQGCDPECTAHAPENANPLGEKP